MFQRDPAGRNGERQVSSISSSLMYALLLTCLNLQVSVGTIWTVGGIAPFTTGVSNGRGGLLGSGTNAPLYTTSFSAARPKVHADIETHEGRLAAALDLDRVSRVLEFRKRAISPPHPVTNGNATGGDPRTVWSGTEWVVTDQNQSMSFPISGVLPCIFIFPNL